MELLGWDEFARKTAGKRSADGVAERFYDSMFECACGDWHEVGGAVVLKAVAGGRLVLACPTMRAIATLVVVRGVFRKKMVSEAGLPLGARSKVADRGPMGVLGKIRASISGMPDELCDAINANPEVYRHASMVALLTDPPDPLVLRSELQESMTLASLDRVGVANLDRQTSGLACSLCQGEFLPEEKWGLRALFLAIPPRSPLVCLRCIEAVNVAQTLSERLEVIRRLEAT